MLIYHPVKDINHCIFRFLLILDKSQRKEINWELFRLIDFYLLFPSQMKEIKPLPNSLRHFKKIINNIPNQFETISNPKRIFFDLQNIQSSTALYLVAKGLINITEFENNRIMKRTHLNLPDKIRRGIDQSSLVSKPWFELAVNGLGGIDTFGKKGIKSRSGLLEFRYDIEE